MFCKCFSSVKEASVFQYSSQGPGEFLDGVLQMTLLLEVAQDAGFGSLFSSHFKSNLISTTGKRLTAGIPS